MPTRPLLSCSYPGCRALVVSGRCTAHRQEVRRVGRSEDKRFYDSALWKRVRNMKLMRDPLCQYCLLNKKLTDASEVDHYVPLSGGGHRTDDANLVSACTPCHSRKTQLEQQGSAPPKHAPSATPRYTCA